MPPPHPAAIPTCWRGCSRRSSRMRWASRSWSRTCRAPAAWSPPSRSPRRHRTGHVLMLEDSGALAINVAIDPNVGYNPLERLRADHPRWRRVPTGFVINPSLPARDLQEYHRARPLQARPDELRLGRRRLRPPPDDGDLRGSHPGSNLAARALSRHGTALVNGLLTGEEIQAGWSGPSPNVIPLIETGKLRGLVPQSVLRRSGLDSKPADPATSAAFKDLTDRPTMIGAAGAGRNAGAGHRALARQPSATGVARSRHGPAPGAARHRAAGERHGALHAVHEGRSWSATARWSRS